MIFGGKGDTQREEGRGENEGSHGGDDDHDDETRIIWGVWARVFLLPSS